MPATVLAYFQLGQFLMLVMVFSFTFSFLSICAVIGPKDNFGQLSISHLFHRCGRGKAGVSKEPEAKNELVILNQNVASDQPSEKANVATLNPNAVSDLSPEQANDSIL